MRNERTSLLIVLILALAVGEACLPVADAQAPDPESVLNKLQNYDRIYSAAITARGTIAEAAPSVETPYLKPEKKSWVLSQKGEKTALIEHLVDPDLGYQPQSDFARYGDDLRGISFDEDGNIGKAFFSYKATSFEGDRSAWVEVMTVYMISPAGKVLSRKDTRTVMRYGPEDSTLKFPINQIRWAMGRGYSVLLDEVTSCVDAGDGLVQLTGSGSCLSAQHVGRWELTIDPSIQYLVRKAVFFSNADAKNKPYLSITNTGIKEGRDVVFPQKAECVMHAFYDETTNLDFNEVVFDADEALIREAREQTDNESSPRTLTIDHTVAPPTSRFVDERGVSPDHRPPMKVQNRFRTWLVIFLIAASAILFVVIRLIRN